MLSELLKVQLNSDLNGPFLIWFYTKKEYTIAAFCCWENVGILNYKNGKLKATFLCRLT